MPTSDDAAANEKEQLLAKLFENCPIAIGVRGGLRMRVVLPTA